MCNFYYTLKKKLKSSKNSNSKNPLISINANLGTKNLILGRTHNDTIDNYYNIIVQNMTSSGLPPPSDLHIINELEEIFIKEFLYQVQFVKIERPISLIRYSGGTLMVCYNSCPIGRINLKNADDIYMQILIDDQRPKNLTQLSFKEALLNIPYWVLYIENHLSKHLF